MRLLTHADQAALERAINQDRYYNLFMIGNLAQMGLDHPDLFYWGQADETGELVGVAMRYRSNWLFYDAGGADLDALARLFDQYPGDGAINGRAALVLEILNRARTYKIKEDHQSYYCAMPLDCMLPQAAHHARRATPDDVPALLKLYKTAGRMSRDVPRLEQTIAHNRLYTTEVEGQLVSAALTSVESPGMAMIGGVFTPEALRNRGYASAAMTALCRSLLEDGIEPCLFYDNPAAGKIYRRLGFEDIGPWRFVIVGKKR